MTEHSCTLPQFKPDNASETTTTQALLTPPPEEQEQPLDQTQDHYHDHDQDGEDPPAAHPQPDTTILIEDVKTYLSTLFFRQTLRLNFIVSTVLDFLHAHPVIATLLLAQLLCSCVPIGLFVAGAVIVASLAVALYSCVAVLVLAPVVIGTSVLGFCVWGWGWVAFVVGKWVLGWLVDGERGFNLDGDLEVEEDRD
ncbi:hypothetical protein ABOM_011581 [Aspergillus bombycis]|uniref:Uncharacterized protein n=1 Tax=Aspergillus bombycis TaxID=109264 RepID=A0A1F7ZK33_9EURO|nr:hypothetical protein ABOM_011581 [Aspergillus bombycis]OGM39807.1 hypothetical protein ABOM_011581 [Aspergillus bombycis]